MPVPRSRRYDSEYASHYKRFEARRPNTVKGEPVRSLSHYNIDGNGSTPRAGLQSTQLGTIHEPPLQRKKIVPYNKNHNIFRTGTTKEDCDQEWLKRDDVSSLGSHSSRNRHYNEGRPTNGKTFILKRGETPILAAERKIFKEHHRNERSQQASATYVPDMIKRRSTYNNDFVNYKKQSKKSQPRSNSKNKQQKSPHKVVGGKKDISPDRLPPAGIRSTTSYGDTRLLQPSDDSMYTRSPERKQPKASKILDSEYRSHFTQPTKFKYVNGLWIETPVGTTGSNEAKRNFADEKRQATPDWFKQVLERRHEAYGYSHNARGTHFSRESLDEMNREQAEQESARSESQISQFSQEERRKNRRVKRTSGANYDKPPQRREAWEEIKPRSPKEPDNVHLNSGTEDISDDEEMVFLERGRSPTPELRDTRDSRRHHLDVTTNILNDSFHKALNLSKNRNGSPKKEARQNQHREMALEEGNPKSTSPASSVDLGGEAGTEARKPQPPRRRQAADKVELSPPSNGRDSPASIMDGRDNRLNPHPRREASHTAKTSPADSGRYSPASSMGAGRDDDVLSVSAMSSRASTASETLERAKKRRDEFWKGGNAGR